MASEIAFVFLENTFGMHFDGTALKGSGNVQ
jgi:hypothetical protein